MEHPPDVVVVGDLTARSAETFGSLGYRLSATHRLGTQAQDSSQVQRAIRSLGADLRNDLNNPLQEIVAMVFVAQAGGEAAATTRQALAAIDGAAKNLAKVVGGLEEKIRDSLTAPQIAPSQKTLSK